MSKSKWYIKPYQILVKNVTAKLKQTKYEL